MNFEVGKGFVMNNSKFLIPNSQFDNRWATASTVTSSVAAATTAPRTCTMLSLLIFSFREARGYGSGSCSRRALSLPFSGSLARASSMASLRVFS
jgi:hypothetical protein